MPIWNKSSEHRKRKDTVALNAKLERDNGSEHQNRRDGSKCWTRVNYSSERWNWEMMVALNAKTGEVALNAELKVWHDDSESRKQWMNGGSKRQTARKRWGGNMPQCSMSPQPSIQCKWLKVTLRVSNDAPLASRNDQVNSEHSLMTRSKKITRSVRVSQ